MALSRAKKEELVATYQEKLVTAPHAFVLGYKGVSVPQVTELRARVREAGAGYMVVKNRLALRAIEGQPLAELKDQFNGPTAVAYSNDDPVALAKTLTEFAKTVPVMEFRGGLLDGSYVGAEQIREIANLPSRDELIAKLLFLLQSPVTRLVRTLAAIPRGFVVVLAEVAKAREGKGGA
jgi:large subunit ribosomal protein L10